MSGSAIIMMIAGCGILWGGASVTIAMALVIEKKKEKNLDLK